MHKGLSEPHILLASSNPNKLIRNLAGVLTSKQLSKIQKEIDKNVLGLYLLGRSHYRFACTVPSPDWRQRVSRLYYAAYNVKRALQLRDSGDFATDVSDHKKIDELPNAMQNVALYKSKLKNMRDDRNLADYSHLATESDLLIPVEEMHLIVTNFLADAGAWLDSMNVKIL